MTEVEELRAALQEMELSTQRLEALKVKLESELLSSNAALVEARLKAEQTPILGQAWVSKVTQGAYPDEPSVLGAGVGPASDASTLVEWLRSEADGMTTTAEFFAGDGDEDLTQISADASRLRQCADVIASLQSQLVEARGKAEQEGQRIEWAHAALRGDAIFGEATRDPLFQQIVALRTEFGRWKMAHHYSPDPNDLTALTQDAERWRSMAEVSDERVDSLLDELDAVARDIDSYAYGLPLMTDEGLPNMRTVVHGWLQSTADALIASQQEKTNA
jgi:predicted Zn-dependent peptidase